MSTSRPGRCDQADSPPMPVGNSFPRLHKAPRFVSSRRSFTVFFAHTQFSFDTLCKSCLSTKFGGLYHFKGLSTNPLTDLFFWVIFYSVWLLFLQEQIKVIIIIAISTLDVSAHILILGSVQDPYVPYMLVVWLAVVSSADGLYAVALWRGCRRASASVRAPF
jgi:hypothetical protein